MNVQSRIPKLNEVSFDGALTWFAEMQTKGLLFHPDDDPAEIYRVSDWVPTFSGTEAHEARFVLKELFESLGDGVYEAAYPVFMNACGTPLDA